MKAESFQSIQLNAAAVCLQSASVETRQPDSPQQRDKKNGVAIKLPLIFCSGQMFLYPSGGKRPPFKTKSGFSYFHLNFVVLTQNTLLQRWF